MECCAGCFQGLSQGRSVLVKEKREVQQLQQGTPQNLEAHIVENQANARDDTEQRDMLRKDVIQPMHAHAEKPLSLNQPRTDGTDAGPPRADDNIVFDTPQKLREEQGVRRFQMQAPQAQQNQMQQKEHHQQSREQMLAQRVAPYQGQGAEVQQTQVIQRPSPTPTPPVYQVRVAEAHQQQQHMGQHEQKPLQQVPVYQQLHMEQHQQKHSSSRSTLTETPPAYRVRAAEAHQQLYMEQHQQKPLQQPAIDPEDSRLSNEAQELRQTVMREMQNLEHQEHVWLSPAILDIYVNARPTLEARMKILKEALTWRIEHRQLLSDLVCPCCSKNPLSHDARCFGVDPEGDLVFMNCFALPRDFNPEGIAQHMACLFELSLKAYPKAKQWTWIIDMHGFGLANCDPRTSIKLLHLLQVAYRGRLKRCLVLNAPFMFGGLWQSIQPWIAPRTSKSIVFNSWPAIQADLPEMLGTEIARRISFEIEENRNPAAVATKTWTTFWAT